MKAKYIEILVREGWRPEMAADGAYFMTRHDEKHEITASEYRLAKELLRQGKGRVENDKE